MVVNASSRVVLRDFTVKNVPGIDPTGNSGGDGLYIGSSGATTIPANIYISNVTMDGNVRQGCSVSSGRHIQFTACSFLNTTGTGPGAGLDLEVNDAATSPLTDVTITGCTFDTNTGGGIISDNDVDGPVTIAGNTFRDCGSVVVSSDIGSCIAIKGSRVAVTGNAFGWNIHRSAVTVKGKDNTITGNSFVGGAGTDVTSCAILAIDTSGLVITGNTIRGTGGTGVRIDARSLSATGVFNTVIANNLLVDVGGGQTLAQGFIVVNSTGPKVAQQMVISGNVCVDSRSGTARADFGIRADVTPAELATYALSGNRVLGQVTRYSGIAFDQLTDHPAAAITTPTAPSAGYVQAEAAAMKTAVDAIRVALTGHKITL
jgi:hypothetical protein